MGDGSLLFSEGGVVLWYNSDGWVLVVPYGCYGALIFLYRERMSAGVVEFYYRYVTSVVSNQNLIRGRLPFLSN